MDAEGQEATAENTVGKLRVRTFCRYVRRTVEERISKSRSKWMPGMISLKGFFPAFNKARRAPAERLRFMRPFSNSSTRWGATRGGRE